MQEEKKQERTRADLIKTIVGITLCVIFGFVLVCNLTIIIKGSADPDNPPSLFSVTPLVVLSGSMSGEDDGHIEIGDLIFLKDVEYSELKEGDVVTFKDGKSYTTHRIIGKDEKGYITKGDANNTEDTRRLTEEKLVGIVTGRIPKVGNFALFLQTPLGMIVFVGVPLIAFIAYDLIRRQMYAKKEGSKTAELEAELERLRALAAANNSPAADATEATAPETQTAENADAEEASAAETTEASAEEI